MYTFLVIQRRRHLQAVQSLLSRNPVVAILGARQVGKTTLAKEARLAGRGPAAWFDLEDPAHLGRLADPMLALRGLRGLVVIDEVQRLPGLFPILRVLADRPGRPAKFLLLGSASPDLKRQGSESLAGRIAHHILPPLGLDEAGLSSLERLWVRGGFPRAFLARSEAASVEWRREFISAFLERDLPQLGFGLPARTMHRFWTMLAHYHGQIWNASEFARSFGVADTTVRNYLDALSATFLVRQLQPWHENLAKRQVKSPKVYLSDSGLLHALLGIESKGALESHPRLGASWEGFALETAIRTLGARPEECYFWATHAGAELDLLVVKGGKRFGFEFKRTEAPALTPSMKIALKDLKLHRLDVVHAGQETFPLAEKVRAIPLDQVRL
ncbi:MAG: ATP-binding protein [Elusimicrobia bacterium]|nr:ATP-binding protein [Elusimicrobiota bacterium]